MNQMIYTAPKLDTVVHYKPGGPMVDLLRDHLTNMTAPQQKVCTSVVTEWNQMVERIRHLESENQKLIHDVARLTHDITSMRDAERFRHSLAAELKPTAKRMRPKRTAKKAKAKR